MTVVVGSEGPTGPSQDEPRLIRVEPSDVGERLDRWLSQQIPEHSRSAIRRFIDEGRITIAAKRCRASHKMHMSEEVLFDPPPVPSLIPLPEDHQLDVLHQDDELIVISKEAGMIVHPAPGAAHEGTLVNALLGHTQTLSSVGDPGRPGIVHRLDRETSGVMVIARTDAAHRELSRQFHDREVSKEYLALSHGTPTTMTGEIDLPLARSLTDPKKRVVRHEQKARESFTAWKLVRKLGDGPEESACWFHCFPRTGRTHQIRVHLRAIGHPILCDFLYGRESTLELSRWDDDAPAATLQRHALHAWRLHFRHPASQQPLQFEAPLPADLKPWWEAARPLDSDR
ncbi:MAG: RluA family pseudouridine synthase [Planctomycetota bacterium]|jgi:23S rRNA pseudouridine1911/1915/1917 synthase